jgi:hypothetical protein
MSEFIIVIVLHSYCVLRPYLIKDENIGKKNETKVLLAYEITTVHMTAFFYELFFARILFVSFYKLSSTVD